MVELRSAVLMSSFGSRRRSGSRSLGFTVEKTLLRNRGALLWLAAQAGRLGAGRKVLHKRVSVGGSHRPNTHEWGRCALGDGQSKVYVSVHTHTRTLARVARALSHSLTYVPGLCCCIIDDTYTTSFRERRRGRLFIFYTYTPKFRF